MGTFSKGDRLGDTSLLGHIICVYGRVFPGGTLNQAWIDRHHQEAVEAIDSEC
jgi:hypothetical protein